MASPLRADTEPTPEVPLPYIEGGFKTVLADPPWRFTNRTGKVAPEHKRLSRYGTMKLEDIKALPVGAVAEETAHLYLWCPNALLPEGLEVMKAWGFTYKSSMVWAKSEAGDEPGERTGRIGMGNYWRIDHEFLLLGVRGKAPFLAHDERSVVEHPPGAHSAKPDVFRGLVEKVSNGPFIELFGRDSGASAPGWVVWGNQIPRTLFAKAISEAVA